jgi:hypothetical protein
MATHYFGADINDNTPADLSYGTSTTSKGIELVVNDATAGIDKTKLLIAVEAIAAKIATGTWPPSS